MTVLILAAIFVLVFFFSSDENAYWSLSHFSNFVFHSLVLVDKGPAGTMIVWVKIIDFYFMPKSLVHSPKGLLGTPVQFPINAII